MRNLAFVAAKHINDLAKDGEYGLCRNASVDPSGGCAQHDDRENSETRNGGKFYWFEPYHMEEVAP